MTLEGRIEGFLDEDFSAAWRDVSSETVEGEASATVVTREDGVAAGVEEADAVFGVLGAETTTLVDDGDRVRSGDGVLRVEGDATAVLRGERLSLNLLGSMSGVATATRRAVDAVDETDAETVVAATRKTTPGYRDFEKRSVRLGGGDPHRHDLTHAVMLKENHLAVAGLETAYRRARELASFTTKVEVEAETVDTAVRAAELGADAVLLDNMSPEGAEEAVDAVAGYDVVVEASGGITHDDVAEYAAAGVDVVSMGGLVHSSDWLDLSMRVDG